jgi:hypothetical protein
MGGWEKILCTRDAENLPCNTDFIMMIFALLVTVTHLILYMPSAWFKVPPYLSAEHSTPSS